MIDVDKILKFSDIISYYNKAMAFSAGICDCEGWIIRQTEWRKIGLWVVVEEKIVESTLGHKKVE